MSHLGEGVKDDQFFPDLGKKKVISDDGTHCLLLLPDRALRFRAFGANHARV
ncbi:MAG: hypothetical protein AB7S38_18100 [Vulcanimicrobiota bacterium]